MKLNKGIIILSCLACALAIPSRTRATNESWNVAGPASWATSTNWNPAATPAPTDNANIDNNGTATVGNGVNAHASNVFVGETSGKTGTVNVQGTGTLTAANDVIVGDNGTGTLNVSGANNATVSGDIGSIGNMAGGLGTATVANTGKWTNTFILYIGNGGNGTLDVTNGGTVSAGMATVARFNTSTTSGLTVEKAGSTFSVTSGTLTIADAGIGTMDIKTGGAVTSLDAIIGSQSLSSGTVTVNGNSGGATWTNSGNLTVGDAGSGTLNIKNAGTVSNVNGIVGNASASIGKVTVDGTGGASMWTNSGFLTVGNAGGGTLSIQAGGAVSNTIGTIGDVNGSTGKVTVDGMGSTWTNSSNLFVGVDGVGTLSITNGGAVSNTNATIASQTDASGSSVTVNASMWTNSGSLIVGDLGNANLTIKGGGAVSNTTGTIANSSGSVSEVDISGKTSTWTNSSSLDVGNGGNGTLDITGGTVSDTFATIADQTGSTGLATVDGKNSTWTNSSSLTVGNSGNGTLMVINGGTVTNTDGTIADQTGSTGSATVDGTGGASTWTMTGDLTVGNSGNGTLMVLAGGTVSSVSGVIANQTGSTGTVTVDGAGSMWTVAGAGSSLEVGVSGTGELDITNGGAVSALTNVVAGFDSGSMGTIKVDGAGSTLTAGDTIIGDLGNGTMNITNGGSVSSGASTIANFAGSNGSSVTVDGTGSSWTNSGQMIVGNVGNATMSITNGGSVSNGDAQIASSSLSTSSVTVDGAGSTWTNSGSLIIAEGGNGTLSITNGGTVTNIFGEIGDVSGAVGMVTVDGTGSNWTMTSDLEVGAHGGNGTMSITNGGVVSNTDSEIGHDFGSTGMVTVDGAGSTWTNSSDLNVGYSGNGTMLVQNGGTVTSAGGSIGSNTGSTGLVNVDGAGSTWTDSGDLTIGDSGNGTMHITNGGQVSNMFGNIASNPGSTGLVTVDGAGSTWTNSGDLFVGDEGGGTMSITNGGTVTNQNGSIANDFGSSGTVTVDGAGSTWTMSGDLQVADEGLGELDITNGGVVSDATGNISRSGGGSNGTAIVDGAGSTWNNSVDLFVGGGSGGPGGPGLLRITNGGTVNVTGNMTVWNTGTLEVGAYVLNASSLTFDGGTLRTIASTNFINNATLASGGVTVDDDGFTSTLSGVFTGPGGLTKIGDGTIIITNTNTYTGDTNINGGTLQLDGSITSNTFVNAGTTLSGIGTVFGNVVNDGTVSPGHSPGTLTISGNYTQTGNGNLIIEVASLATHDLLQVGGAANLDGNLQIVKLANFSVQAGEKVIFLTAAGGVNGEFATVMSNFGATGTLVTPEVVYEANDVALLFAQSSFLIGGLTPNQTAVAINLNNSIGDPRAANLLNFLDSELIANLPHDYDLIAPEELAALYEISFSKAIVQNQNLQHRMDDIRAGSSGFASGGLNMNAMGAPVQDPSLSYGFTDGKVVLPVAYTDGKVVLPTDNKDKDVMTPTPENHWGVWVTGYGDFVNVDGNDNAHGYDISTGSVLVGLDYKVCDHFAIGLDGSYSGGQANLVDDGRIDYDGGQAGAYATIYGIKGLFGNIIHVDMAVNGGWNDYDTVRTGLQNMAVRGSTDGSEFNAMIAYGGDWYFGHWLVGTWSSLQYTDVHVNDFTETGSLAPLHFPDQSEDSLRTSSGLRLAYNANWGRMIFRPEIRAAWEHDYGDRAYPIDARFASGAGGIFTVHGPDIGRDSALVDAGFSLIWSDRVSTYLFYDGNLGRSHYDNNAVSGGLRIAF